MKFTIITTMVLSTLLSTTAAMPSVDTINNIIEDREVDILVKKALEDRQVADVVNKVIEDRQVADAMQTQNLNRATSILNSARSSAVGNIRGRRLTEARERRCEKNPPTECNKCMDALVQTAIFQVMECGVAALGVGALTGGVAAALAAMGFLACDGVVYGSYEKGLVECRAF
ncbi:uncharacterized protein CTRU02_208276 [Colletotrichum truncatum]|uniref:Uncharacterized protein n=1 Tax=Colletotrichum truncatum TaxID=5467 RepID=A0ACC3YVU8_COLTU